MYTQQAVELDYKRREAILHQMQQIVHQQAIYAPIWQLARSFYYSYCNAESFESLRPRPFPKVSM
jgi:ABC-type transport system substrate-binding protein